MNLNSTNLNDIIMNDDQLVLNQGVENLHDAWLMEDPEYKQSIWNALYMSEV
jgi:hypothetical protein